jgi:hypothetical protein
MAGFRVKCTVNEERFHYKFPEFVELIIIIIIFIKACSMDHILSLYSLIYVHKYT